MNGKRALFLLATSFFALPLFAETFDFEGMSVFKAGGMGKTFVNPTGDYMLDTTGKDAHSGKNAVLLRKDGRITMDFRSLAPNQKYRLTAWVKGEGTANAQIEWFHSGTPKNEYRSIKMVPGRYRRMILDAVAPAGVTHAYLKFFPSPDAPNGMWIDDISMEPCPVEANAPLLGFEEPLTGPGGIGNSYVNPTGTFEYDDSGKNAHSGIGSVQLIGKGRITIDYKDITPGKTYRFSAWFKGKGTGFVQMQWLGKNGRLESKSAQLSATEFKEISIKGVAPEGAKNLYLHVFLSGDDSAAWVDDIRMNEEKSANKNLTSLSVEFTGKHKRFSVYQSGEKVEMIVRSNQRIPAPDRLNWTLCDYRNRPLEKGVIAVTPEALTGGLPFFLSPKRSGSYFLHMKLEKSGATIAWKGSRHPGFVSFGILPSIQALPLAAPEESRFGGQGTNFIESGEFMKGNSLAPFYPTVGMKWSYFGGGGLNDLEPKPGAFQIKSAEEYRSSRQPDPAINGMAEIHDLLGAPAFMLKLPESLKGKKLNNVQAQSYPLSDPAAYGDLIGRIVRDRKARSSAFFPNRKNNYFQIHWEPDWHWQGNSDEFLEYYRVASKAMRASDPSALLLGPNYGVLSVGCEKMETLFQKGLGKYIDGVLIHLYFLPVSGEPEASGLPADCRKIRKMTDRYIRPGAPLINTEWGVDYRGKDTADISFGEWENQLSRFLRGHLIALGEGFTGTWFFYTTDYCTYESTSGEQGYGISFNTSDYINQYKFGAAALEPKPTMMGAAAMTRLLEGTRALGRLDHLAPDVYAYSFRRGTQNMLVIWKTGKSARLILPVGNGPLSIYDCMGNEEKAVPEHGMLSLEVSGFPQYILGVSDRVLATARPVCELAPGAETVSLFRSTPASLVLRNDRMSRTLRAPFVLPEEIPAGAFELAAFDAKGNPLESRLLHVTGRAEISLPEESLNKEGHLQFSTEVKNRSAKKASFDVTASFNGKVFAKVPVTLAAGSSKTILIPGTEIGYDGLKPGKLILSVSDPSGVQAEIARPFAYLRSVPAGRIQIDGNVRDHFPRAWSRWFGKESLTHQMKRHQGDNDFSARWNLSARGDMVYLAVQVRDNVAMPATLADMPWRNDSLILALGRAFDGKGTFQECQKIAFTRDAAGKVLIQDIRGTPPKEVRPFAAPGLECAILRNEDSRLTTYEVAIPRSLFGKRNEMVGLGITLHDTDTVEEVKKDIHREMSLAGGVPLFMGNVQFAVLLFAESSNPGAFIWDLTRFSQPPAFRKAGFPESEVPNLSAILYEGVPAPDGKKTEVFAYYGLPDGARPAKGYPAVLLSHGGGGTAFASYAELYRKRGYAVFAPDLYGKRPHGLKSGTRTPVAGGDIFNWEYQSVGNLLLAKAFLFSRPEIDSSKIAMVGISWGGVFSSIVTSLSPGFRLISPVYGCGFFAEGDASSNFGKTMRSEWYDPANYVADAKSPMYCLIGADDGSFSRDSWLKTVETIPTMVTATLLPKLSHSHEGFRHPAVLRMTDWALKGTPPLPSLSVPVRKGNLVISEVKNPGRGIISSVLIYTTDSASVPVQNRTYRTVPAQLAGKTLSAELPPNTRECWFAVYDQPECAGTSALLNVFTEKRK